MIDLTGPRSHPDAPPLRFDFTPADTHHCPPRDKYTEYHNKVLIRVTYSSLNYHLAWTIPEIRHQICTYLWADPCWTFNLCSTLDDLVTKTVFQQYDIVRADYPAVSREMMEWWIDFQIGRIEVRVSTPKELGNILRPHTMLKEGGYLPTWWEDILMHFERLGLETAVKNSYSLKHLKGLGRYACPIPGWNIFRSYPHYVEPREAHALAVEPHRHLRRLAYTTAYERWMSLINFKGPKSICYERPACIH